MINNFGLAVSFNNIVEGLKKGGNEIKNYTISKYVKALINAKILYECDRFDLNSNKSLKGETTLKSSVLWRNLLHTLLFSLCESVHVE